VSASRAIAHAGGRLDFEIAFTGASHASIWIDGARLAPITAPP
jgi:hypothetical protein